MPKDKAYWDEFEAKHGQMARRSAENAAQYEDMQWGDPGVFSALASSVGAAYRPSATEDRDPDDVWHTEYDENGEEL